MARAVPRNGYPFANMLGIVCLCRLSRQFEKSEAVMDLAAVQYHVLTLGALFVLAGDLLKKNLKLPVSAYRFIDSRSMSILNIFF